MTIMQHKFSTFSRPATQNSETGNDTILYTHTRWNTQLYCLIQYVPPQVALTLILLNGAKSLYIHLKLLQYNVLSSSKTLMGTLVMYTLGRGHLPLASAFWIYLHTLLLDKELCSKT